MCPHAYSWLAATALLSMLACSDKQTPVAPPFDLAYATNPAVYEVGTSIPANPASCRGGPVQQFTVTPDLPGGLVLDAITGAITGTPTTIAPEATYAVVARNRAGLATAAVTITVNDAEPTGLSYATNPATYVGGAAITPNAPISGGGAIVSFSVSPALPPGLSLDPATRLSRGARGQGSDFRVASGEMRDWIDPAYRA